MRKILLLILTVSFIFSLLSCGVDYSKPATIDDVLLFNIQSDPEGADVHWRVSSDVPEVQSTNRAFLGTTPYSETRSLRIPGITEDNKEKVTVVIEVVKRGYNTAVERYNVKSILHDRRIS